MFPITKGTLSFLDISKYWSREIRPPASQNELLKLLEGAWWLGEIHGDEIPRLERLKRMFKSMHNREDVGIVFIVGEGPGQPEEAETLADGSMRVRVRHEVPLPSRDTPAWNEDACKEAFHALAQTSSTESYPELAPLFAFIEITYDEFTDWLTRCGYTKPKFWSPFYPC